MQLVATTPVPRDWWQELSKTPDKLGNSDLFAKKCLWKHRYLEVAVPPAKGSCCSTIKELSKLLFWQFLPWEAELVRHSRCTSPLQLRDVMDSGVRTDKPLTGSGASPWAATSAAAAPNQELTASLTPSSPGCKHRGASADTAPGGGCSREALDQPCRTFTSPWKEGLDSKALNSLPDTAVDRHSQWSEFVSRAAVVPSRSVQKKRIAE